MSYGFYDIDGLAAFLHLTPQQVMRLAERGRIPGRKVAGRWRFSKPEIHEWFERRIGLSDEEELLEVENVLRRNAGGKTAEEVCIADLLPLRAVAVPLFARTRNSAIDAMTELAARTGWLWDARGMSEAVRAREEMHPTALDNGVALLHPRRPMPDILARPFLALGCTTTGIPFGGRTLTDVFFLVCSTDEQTHLRVLARLSRLLSVPGFLNALHMAPDAEAAHGAVVEHEASLR